MAPTIYRNCYLKTSIFEPGQGGLRTYPQIIPKSQKMFLVITEYLPDRILPNIAFVLLQNSSSEGLPPANNNIHNQMQKSSIILKKMAVSQPPTAISEINITYRNGQSYGQS
jgi:hypothetical protein